MGIFDEGVLYTDAYGTELVGYVDSNGIPRTDEGKPLISSPCPHSDVVKMVGQATNGGEFRQQMRMCVDGRAPGKRAGTTKACPTCKGKGRLFQSYTRATSHDVMESTFGLEKWKQRLVLIGLKRDADLVTDLTVTAEDDKDRLAAIAEQAFATGDGYVKAHKGTDLHKLSEYVDRQWRLPEWLTSSDGIESPVTLQDRADMAAWRRAVLAQQLEIVAMEKFVVLDDLKVAGTLDRLARWPRSPCDCGGLTIVDLKTGRMDFGGGKMTQQLSLYSHGEGYDPQTTQRSPLGACQHVGLVINVPAGTGRATCHTVDLVAGWEYVQLNLQVRQYRNACRSSIRELT